jgi:23S rRNA U2552 (ribose-2'-O)-methylase RlmE/FtsJ
MIRAGTVRVVRHWKRRRNRFLDGLRYGKAIQRQEGLPEPIPGPLEAYFDRHTEGPGIWKWRHYFPIYERHLARFVGREPVVLEIGVYSGGSLNMWRDYFGAATKLLGVDIEAACRVYETIDTHILIGDQADPNFLQTVLDAAPEGVDVIVDDAGHRPDGQIASLEGLLPHLRPGGVYMIEDIHGEEHPFHDYIDGLARNLHRTQPSSFDFRANGAQATIASITLYPFLTVIEKRSDRLERMVAPKHGTHWQPFYDNDGWC